MASLKDISKICGVSVATVSKALNDHKDIGEETRLLYKLNIQKHLFEIVNYRQNGYFLEKNCKKVLQNAQSCYILKLRKRLSYKTGRTE